MQLSMTKCAAHWADIARKVRAYELTKAKGSERVACFVLAVTILNAIQVGNFGRTVNITMILNESDIARLARILKDGAKENVLDVLDSNEDLWYDNFGLDLRPFDSFRKEDDD